MEDANSIAFAEQALPVARVGGAAGDGGRRGDEKAHACDRSFHHPLPAGEWHYTE